jgi:small subunit ribosomal protein S14
MAKKGKINNNLKRRHMADQFAAKREELKAITRDQNLPMEDRFAATLKLAELPRNSAPSRVRNRCDVTGRPRAYYRKLKMSRIALRELGSDGKIPGLVKSSW